MTQETAAQKQQIRREIRSRIQSLSPSQRATESARAWALFRRQPLWKNAQTILFYAPLKDEIDLSPAIAEAVSEGKTVALPCFVALTGVYQAFQIVDLQNDCRPGRFGILEPEPRQPQIPLNRLDLALVPGVGFDVAGRRLGRGRGFYDRLLAQTTGIKCGVGFDEQVVPEIPAEAHDINLNYLLTPSVCLEIPGPQTAV